MNAILKEDIDRLLARNEVDFSAFAGKTILVTGATGLIGYNLISVLRAAAERLNVPLRVVAMARSADKARALFGPDMPCVIGDINDPITLDGPVDYLVHAASETASKAFVQDPVGVIMTAVNGTRNALDFARDKGVAAMVYLSTMEIYGAPQTEDKVAETHGTNLDPMQVRSSYPESKRLCECLCAAYAAQYGVPARVMRLIQTFGPGVRYDDGRVFAEFARCALEKRNIVLHTSGATKRNYLYTADAVTAILTVLLKGADGEAYNTANDGIFCSIREMAELVCRTCGNGEISVDIRIEDEARHGYAPTLMMNLDTSRLRALGWQPHYGLEEMYRRLCASMREDQAS